MTIAAFFVRSRRFLIHCLTGMALLPPQIMKTAMPVSLFPSLSRKRAREIKSLREFHVKIGACAFYAKRRGRCFVNKGVDVYVYR